MRLASYSFGEFQLDSARFELTRDGQPVKLERIPMELLILLAESSGNVVSRQEIAERLWGKDVHVDTEHGINTAVRKIRQALRDDPESPRYVLTVTGKGYRFVAEQKDGTNSKPHASALPAIPPQPAVRPPTLAHKRPWRLGIALAGLAILALAVIGIRERRPKASPVPRIQSIAVLPLANLSGDRSKDYFADGMTDELITALAKNRSLKVVSRTTIMQYQGTRRPLGDIARELGVDAIVEGSVEQSGSRVHMTVQLIRAASDTHLWAESYDRDWKESFSLASELSENVAREVGLAVTPHSTKYVSPEAHDLYLRGRYFWFNDNYDRAEDYFQKSKDLQPDYAAAWTGIADIQTVKAVAAIEPSAKVRQTAEEAAHRAVDLDNLLPEAHNALAATYLFLEWDWQRAEEESRRALELNPNFAEGHHLRSYVLAALNRMDEALQEQQRGLDLDPFQRPWSLGAAYIQLRRYDDAIRELEMRKEAQPENVWVRFTLFRAYGHKQMWAEAAREFEQGVRLSGGKQAIREIHSQVEHNGPKGVLEFQLRDSLREVGKTYVSPVELASHYAWLGKKEETLKWLEAACNERAAWLVFVQDDPVYDFVHSEPRYQAIVKKMGLPPAF